MLQADWNREVMVRDNDIFKGHLLALKIALLDYRAAWRAGEGLVRAIKVQLNHPCHCLFSNYLLVDVWGAHVQLGWLLCCLIRRSLKAHCSLFLCWCLPLWDMFGKSEFSCPPWSVLLLLGFWCPLTVLSGNPCHAMLPAVPETVNQGARVTVTVKIEHYEVLKKTRKFWLHLYLPKSYKKIILPRLCIFLKFTLPPLPLNFQMVINCCLKSWSKKLHVILNKYFFHGKE